MKLATSRSIVNSPNTPLPNYYFTSSTDPSLFCIENISKWKDKDITKIVHHSLRLVYYRGERHSWK